MAVYCWGSTTHGELGLGGIEEELISTPRQMPWNLAPDLIQAACGYRHTLLLSKNGKVYSCGNNDHGQLGHDLPRKRPQPVSGLDNYFITSVCCGSSHSLALNEWGQLFSWGSGSFGQLGHDNEGETQNSPKIIKLLATKTTVQIACGYYHCLALTNSGELYAWGANMYGQLGLGNTSEKVKVPAQIISLSGLPIAYIACGAYHSFAISKSGAVFAWGKNESGQLGLNDELPRPYPTHLKTLRSLGVRYIACGEEFSCFLTMEGGVFTCGAGTYGQLGHGNCANESMPRMIMELMGSTITQISCGSRHTLALVASRGRVYGFGLNSSGQLGGRNTNNSCVPQVVLGPWVSPSGHKLFDNKDDSVNMEIAMTVKKIFSGGDQSFVSTTEYEKRIAADDCRFYKSNTQILNLTVDMGRACSIVPNDVSVDLDLLANIETIFKSQACINASFFLKSDRHITVTSKHHCVDLSVANETFGYLRKIENENLKQLIWDSITLELLNTLISSPPDKENLRIYMILPLYHEFVNAKNYRQLHAPFSQAVLQLQKAPRNIVLSWWTESPLDYFETLASNFKTVIWYVIHFKGPVVDGEQKKMLSNESNLVSCLQLLKIIYEINQNRPRDKLPYDFFYISDLTDFMDIQQDYIKWTAGRNGFYLCNFPFLFDAKAKTLLLQTDQALQMHSAMQNAATQGFLSTMFGNISQPIYQFIVLNVSRENIVQDTLREITQYGPNDLKKPLKVKFHGEEAEDAGGVRKEFFMFLLKDILDLKYGMFKEFEDSRAMWFAEYSFETEGMYFLIGVICGLAIYNFTIINLPFPLALYKKLLREPVNITDLRDLSPSLANSMQNILDYEGDDFEQVFDLTFEITQEVFGETRTIPLKPNGGEIPVTQENKSEFVDLYIDYIFNKSVETQFKAFNEGFMKVCGGTILQLFKATELMAVVVGNEDYDWDVLESEAGYKNGYTSGDQTIRWFWEVFHELPLAEKKKFLLFLTGSDRIPLEGMKAIKIFIQPTTDERFLPVAHTCFNLLDLPHYSTKERLKYKLLQAIQQTQGFSIV